MRVFALSDIHADYSVNKAWVAGISLFDYQDDVLILAGDVSDVRSLLEWCLGTLARRFKKVLFVPGNHDLWVIRDVESKTTLKTSFDKFYEVRDVVDSSGASMRSFRERDLLIVPLLGWYDFSFGDPSEELRSIWTDFYACRWPKSLTEKDITAHFAALNSSQTVVDRAGDKIITYSHFVPRIDLMPAFIPSRKRLLYPILGSTFLETQLRRFAPSIHVYGHSHVNCQAKIDGVSYINNAFGYPSETRITAKRLLCIYEC